MQPSIAGSQFGNGNRIHLGSINFQLPRGPHPNETDRFLAILCPRAVQNEISSIGSEYRASPVDAFCDWTITPDRGLRRWLEQDESRLLWIQDDTNSGHTLFMYRTFDALSNMRTTQGYQDSQPLVISYVFCRPTKHCSKCPTKHSSKCPTTALRVLIYQLIADNKTLFGQPFLTAFMKSYAAQIEDCPEELQFEKLSNIFMATVRDISQRLPRCRILLLVEGLDWCERDDLNDEESFRFMDLMGHAAAQVRGLRWIVSGVSSDRLRRELLGLESQYGGQRKCLTTTEIVTALGLDKSVQLLKRTSSLMRRTFNTAQTSPDNKGKDVSWFRYTKAGRLWLDASDGNHQAVWYEKGKGSSSAPSSLGVRIQELLSGKTEYGLATAYFSFPSVLAEREPSSNPLGLRLPIVAAIWSLFTQFASVACETEDAWSDLLVRMPTGLQSELRKLSLILEKPNHSTNQATPDEDNGCDMLEEWYRDISVVDHTYKMVLIELLVWVASKLSPKNPLLVLDGIELAQAGTYGQVLELIQAFSGPTAKPVRVLLCGNLDAMGIQEGDGRAINGLTALAKWVEFPGNAVNESTEYEGQSASFCLFLAHLLMNGVEFLEGLDFDDIHTRRDQVADAFSDTNQWLWRHNAFRSWISSAGLLWISGKAGSGKSVLAKTIQRHFSRESKAQAKPLFVCDWFYSARMQEVGMAHTSMLRAILYQIMSHHKEVYGAVQHRYRSYLTTDPSRCWTRESLETMLRDVAKSPLTPHTLAVIDALDESEDGTASSESRSELIDMLCDITREASGTMHLIVLSRPDPKIEKKLRRCHRILLHEQNRADIDAIIEAGLNDIRRAWIEVVGFVEGDVEVDETEITNDPTGDPGRHNVASGFIDPTATGSFTGIRVAHHSMGSVEVMPLPADAEDELNDIRTYLQENALGVVLWVSLVLQQLQQYIASDDGFTLGGLTDILHGLPKELDNLYSHIISRLGVLHNPRRLALAKTMLSWIIGASRWASLELHELHGAITLLPEGPQTASNETGRPRHDADSRRQFQIGGNWDLFCEIIYQHCGPLVEIQTVEQPVTAAAFSGQRRGKGRAGPMSTVQLLHQTARSFLEDKTRSGFLHIDTQEAGRWVVLEAYNILGFEEPLLDTPPRPRRNTEHWYMRNVIPVAYLRNYDHPWELAVDDYCRERPLRRLALRIVDQYLHADDWVLVSSFGLHTSHVDDTPDCFLVHWFVNIYHSEVGIHHYCLIRIFIKYCCWRGQTIVLEKAFDLVGQYSSRYTCDAVDWRTVTLAERVHAIAQRAMIQGAMDAIQAIEGAEVSDKFQSLKADLDELWSHYFNLSEITVIFEDWVGMQQWRWEKFQERSARYSLYRHTVPRTIAMGQMHDALYLTIKWLKDCQMSAMNMVNEAARTKVDRWLDVDPPRNPEAPIPVDYGQLH
ncbi:hypothetical protein CONLIGDRAFT_690163 [Coniochaeta ligniaria NRRL 30616]|uniref:Nephrocystin 3-like N-terminal domain-containing protein n=1 Tax=Coniochaeta ligniaria NRRL 30616 TaxID=1408157 RepID=A0A1J7J7Z1_9PEZI|nr:hypothetical protein CONLIGDRAFT_690163 [Coniochaeta ligniaria NRRL 30616]